MDYPLILTYILSILLFLGTPGHVTVMIVNTASRYGFKAGLATVAGTNTASLMLIAASFLVIQGLFTVSQTALLILTLFGSVYLAYFAVGVLQDSVNIAELNDTKLTIGTHHFKDGFIVGISNPKDILFFIAFFPVFFGVEDNTILAMVVLTAIWVLLDYAILSVYSLIFAKVVNDKWVNIIGKLSGLVLLLVAIYAINKTTHELFL